MNEVTHNKIVSFIWGIADDVLRDLFKRGKYPDVILPMCVIRRMDAVLEPTKRIIDDIAPKVAESTAYRNARENTPHTARMVHDEALGKVMQLILKDDTQFYKLFVENDAFRRELGDVVYAMTSG